MDSISTFLIKTDQFFDYIPLASSLTNLVDLFQKCVILPFINRKTIESNHYYKHIDDKRFTRCFWLVIPVIGNIIIGIDDFSKKKHGNGPVGKLAGKNDNSKGIKIGKQAIPRPLDIELEKISKMSKTEIEAYCKDITVTNRNEYIKWMLVFAIKAENFEDNNVDTAFHDMTDHFREGEGVKKFVHEDIAAGRDNEKDTLLHEILNCRFLSAQSKGSAFDFILRDGHTYLRDYLGNRTVAGKNEWGVEIVTFPEIKWGDSLKEIFNNFSNQDQEAFFSKFSEETPGRLQAFTGIQKT